MAAKKKGAGGSLTRSQIVTVRFDPKLRYLAELAALKQRRTLSSYIEWAVQESLKKVSLDEYIDVSLHDKADDLWDVDAPDRFVKLAFHYPELLTHEEQIKWKLIRENGHLWRGKYINDEWAWTVSEHSLVLERLREYWDFLCRIAGGDEDVSALPTTCGPSQEDNSPDPDQSGEKPSSRS